MRTAQKETSNAIECAFIAKNDRPTQSAALKAIEATKEVESGAAIVKEKAKKLIKEENDAIREKEIEILSSKTHEVNEALEQTKGMALEACISLLLFYHRFLFFFFRPPLLPQK